MMKRVFLTAILAIAAIVYANAQQISVVAPNGTTTLLTDLNAAINDAAAGSTIYLSGGGFQLSDDTKITKKLTIIGIGHKPNNENADGSTLISGNLFFDAGSDNSTLMGVHVSGNVNIGTGIYSGSNVVNTILVRFCNINSLQVHNGSCRNILINQNYIRNNSGCGHSAVTFTNNILHSITDVNGGVIDHNIVRHSRWEGNSAAFQSVSNSQIKNNILVDPAYYILTGGENTVSNNMLLSAWGEKSVVASNWDDIFVGTYAGVSTADNYALKPGAPGTNDGTDNTDIGIYGGTGFSNSALPPGPRIISKKVAEQTDASGKLHVELKVSAK